MKKHLWIVFLALATCLVLFSGCSLIKGLEQDVEITLYVDGESIGTYTVSTFKNAVVPEPEAPNGMQFAGWTNDANWADKDVSEIFLTENTGLLRYAEIKDFVGKDNKLSLYGVFTAIPQHDVAVAWYRAQGQSTDTGLTEEIMQAFEQNLRAYLTSLGKNPSEMDIVIRAYDGSVAVSCAAIKKDGDIDIMIGWAGNIGSTGGLVEGTDYLENVSGISVGTKSRSAARLNDKELTNQVFAWILDEYGPEPITDPTIDPETIERPADKTNVIIAWYAKTDTSGIEKSHMETLQTNLTAYLVTKGFAAEELNVAIYGFTGDVETSCNNLKKAGGADIMVGWGGNIKSKGGIDFLENVSGIQIGTVSGRYVARLTDSYLSKLVCVWVQNTYGAGGVAEPNPDGTDPEPDDDPNYVPIPDITTQHKMIIGWYAKTSTSGLTQEIIDNFEVALKEFLVTSGYSLDDVTIIFRDYAHDAVADMGAAINKDAIVDVLIGVGNNIDTTAGVTIIEKQGNISMGGKSRYIARLTDTDISVLVYEWIKAGGAEDSLAEPPKQDEGFTPDPNEQYTIVIGWYSKTGTTGLDGSEVNALVEALKEYIQTKYGITVTIDLRDLGKGNVQSVADQVIGADFDIVIGMGGDLKGMIYKTGYYQDGVTMGTGTGAKAGRNIFIVDSSTSKLATAIWGWLVGDSDNEGWLKSTEAQEVGIYIPKA